MSWSIGGVWLTTDHARVPFAAFFGDEGYFIRRATWLRNVTLGIPIHSADLIYAFDDYSYMHYMYFIAFVEALVGFAPYGLKILSAAMYVAGAVVLFRLARSAYGSGVALAGLLVVLFLPSLFAWSIAVLKEPPYFLIGALGCAAAAGTMRTRSMTRRVAGVLFLCAAAGGLQSIREGSLVIGVAGLGGGMLLGWLARRPRAALVFAVAVPIAVMAALSRPAIQLKAVQAIRTAATLHWWQVNTPGYSYQTLDAPLYSDKAAIDQHVARRDRSIPRPFRRGLSDGSASVDHRVARGARLRSRADVLVWHARAAADRPDRRAPARCRGHDGARRATRWPSRCRSRCRTGISGRSSVIAGWRCPI